MIEMQVERLGHRRRMAVLPLELQTRASKFVKQGVEINQFKKSRPEDAMHHHRQA
jgi:hypothetical protein